MGHSCRPQGGGGALNYYYYLGAARPVGPRARHSSAPISQWMAMASPSPPTRSPISQWMAISHHHSLYFPTALHVEPTAIPSHPLGIGNWEEGRGARVDRPMLKEGAPGYSTGPWERRYWTKRKVRPLRIVGPLTPFSYGSYIYI